MTTLSRPDVRQARGLAALLVAGIALVCLSAFGPAGAADPACPGLDSAPRFCAQPGALDAGLVAIAPVVSPEPVVMATAGLPLGRLEGRDSQFHGALSTSRAPPLPVF